MSVERQYSVYAVRHLATGKHYFGQTSSSVSDRWTGHLACRKRKVSEQSEFIRALVADGPEAFQLIPMLSGLSKDSADEWERTMVERFEARGVFNYTFTEKSRAAARARFEGSKASAETRAKQSASHRARWASMSPGERRANLNGLGEAGANARRGMRRIRENGVVKYVAWQPGDDPVEIQRARWRMKAKRARERRAALKGGT